jgi:hypothetical protein
VALGLGGVTTLGLSGGWQLLPAETQQLLTLMLWDLNAPAVVAAGVGGVAALGILATGSGRKVRWLTPEHQHAARARRARFLALPVAMKQRLMAPPLLAWSTLGLPHLALWAFGTTRFVWPAWVGTDVPLEPWLAGMVELLQGPVGQGWNLLMPSLGWGVFVGLAWRPFRQRWHDQVVEGRAFTGKTLPDPGPYQREERSWWMPPKRQTAWRKAPTFLLGAREMPSSRGLEPHCELPSWVLYQGKPIFGGLIVFGQKGSGKTSLLQRIIEDTLRYRPDDDKRKPAMMALDPKGDLSAFIGRLAAEHGRGDDVVRLAVGGEVTWNPFGHLGPDTPARQIRQAGYFLRCAMPMGGGDNTYWEDNATNLLSYSMQLLAYAGETVSFATLADLVTALKGAGRKRSKPEEAAESDSFRDPGPSLEEVEPAGERRDEDVREALYRRAAANLTTDEQLAELDNVRRYFEEEFVHLDAKPRSIIVNTATNFLRKFEGAAYRRTFCGSSANDNAFQGFEGLVDEGRIFVLDIRAVEDGQVSAALCCLAKLFCQAAILTRDRRPAGVERVVVNVMDEYQQYVTPGGSGSQGDPEYLETSRSFRAIDVAATQQLSALQDAVGGRDAAQRVAGSFNSLVLFRHNDHALTQYAGHLVGRRERIERSYNVSEGGQDAERHNVLGDGVKADKQSVTRSVSERTVEKDLITDDLFASLQTFEAIGIFSAETGRQLVRFCSKPQWLPARTPQHEVVKHLEGKATRRGAMTWIREVLGRNAGAEGGGS